MRPTSLIPACVAATLFLAPFVMAAEPTPSGDGSSATKGQRQAEWVKRWDKNGDGKLDDAERATAKEAMSQQREGKRGRAREHMLKKHDKDGDGKLNEAERTAAAEDIYNRPRVIKRFDADGDGKLNDQEKAAAKQAVIDRAKAQE